MDSPSYGQRRRLPIPLPLQSRTFGYAKWDRSNVTVPEQANLARLIETLRKQLPLLVERYRVESLGVFGSYVRHEQRSDSDLDVLVVFHEPPSLLEFIELENHLSDVLGVKIDLIMKDSLKTRIGERVLKEVAAV